LFDLDFRIDDYYNIKIRIANVTLILYSLYSESSQNMQ